MTLRRKPAEVEEVRALFDAVQRAGVTTDEAAHAFARIRPEGVTMGMRMPPSFDGQKVTPNEELVRRRMEAQYTGGRLSREQKKEQRNFWFGVVFLIALAIASLLVGRASAAERFEVQSSEHLQSESVAVTVPASIQWEPSSGKWMHEIRKPGLMFTMLAAVFAITAAATDAPGEAFAVAATVGGIGISMILLSRPLAIWKGFR